MQPGHQPIKYINLHLWHDFKFKPFHVGTEVEKRNCVFAQNRELLTAPSELCSIAWWRILWADEEDRRSFYKPRRKQNFFQASYHLPGRQTKALGEGAGPSFAKERKNIQSRKTRLSVYLSITFHPPPFIGNNFMSHFCIYLWGSVSLTFRPVSGLEFSGQCSTFPLTCRIVWSISSRRKNSFTDLGSAGETETKWRHWWNSSTFLD